MQLYVISLSYTLEHLDDTKEVYQIKRSFNSIRSLKELYDLH